MLENLKVINLKKSPGVDPLKGRDAHDLFILDTCQRSLIVGTGNRPLRFLGTGATNFDLYNGEKAYRFLLETACGLQSKLLGEQEVTAQFRKGHHDYLLRESKNPMVIKVLEKIFKDTKDIRSKYLQRLGQYSYAGLTRRLIDHTPCSGRVLILGSGQLAFDLHKVLSKKYELDFSARHPEKLKNICPYQHLVSFNNIENWGEHSHIINTIGGEKISSADRALLDESFFDEWKKNHPNSLFVDLGSPSAIHTQLGTGQGLYRLNDLFDLAKEYNHDKNIHISQAKEAIDSIVQKRAQTFEVHVPLGWEELQFA